MASFDEPNVRGDLDARHLLENALGPGACDVHDRARMHLETTTRAPVFARGLPCAVLLLRGEELRMRQNRRTALGRIDCIQDDEPAVIHATIGIEESGAQIFAQHVAVRRTRKIDRTRGGKLLAPADMVIEEEAETDLPARARSRRVRQYELHRRDDVRRQCEQALALLQRLAHEPELVEFEIPQPAVDQLRACGRGARGEIGLFDERHAQSAAGGVPRDADAVDTSAHDKKIDAGGIGQGCLSQLGR